MTITVRLFAQLREQFGYSSSTMDLPVGTTVSQVFSRLGEIKPAAQSLLAKSLPAIAAEYTSRDCVLRDGQELAIVPPVSGG